VDNVTVPHDGDEAGIGDLVALFVETGRMEDNIEALPLIRRAAGVHPGRMTTDALLVDPLVVDAPAGAVCQFGDSPAIEDLNLILAHEVDA
jgi:hypothetical protein